MHLYLHLCVCVCVCGGGGAVKALVRLSAWVAASKRWCLIDCTICRPTRHFMGRPIFFTKQPSYYRKVVPLIYNWASTRRFGIYLRCVQLFFKTCMDMNLVWLEVLMLAYTFIYTHSLCVCVCVCVCGQWMLWRDCLHAQLHPSIGVLLTIQ